MNWISLPCIRQAGPITPALQEGGGGRRCQDNIKMVMGPHPRPHPGCVWCSVSPSHCDTSVTCKPGLLQPSTRRDLKRENCMSSRLTRWHFQSPSQKWISTWYSAGTNQPTYFGFQGLKKIFIVPAKRDPGKMGWWTKTAVLDKSMEKSISELRESRCRLQLIGCCKARRPAHIFTEFYYSTKYCYPALHSHCETLGGWYSTFISMIRIASVLK